MICRLLTTSAGPKDEFVLQEGLTRIGREPDNDIQLMGENVSRHHAVVKRNGDRCVVQDRRSVNGTFVNGATVKTCQLSHGDELRIGDWYLVFESIPDASVDDPPVQANEISRRSLLMTAKRSPSMPESGAKTKVSK